jgi:hypothetical protein
MEGTGREVRMPTDKRSTTFRLSEGARQLLEQLSDHHGISQTAIMEMAIRDLARRDLGDQAGQQPAGGAEAAPRKTTRRKKT